MNTQELIIYRNLPDSEILDIMTSVVNDYESGKESNYTCRLNSVISKLIAYAEERGLYGNLWADYLTNVLVNAENAYSTACEIGGEAVGSINDLVLQDMGVLHGIYNYDFEALFTKTNCERLMVIMDYEVIGSSQVYNSRVRERICTLSTQMEKATDAQTMKQILTEFYQKYGVGKFGLHKAFRIEENKDGEVDITPILKIAHVGLGDIIGYEIPKQKLIDNTEAFVNKRPSNNCLLYGDAGTGKSSSIKAIANEYYESGLRIIEVYRHQFRYLNDLIGQIKDRNYRFIIYMDDLSFEDFETEYKYLKAIIEGGLEKRPDNVLIYATSNRRHLIKETVSDRDDRDPDMHRSDTMSEKLSLSNRFGESIYFGAPDKKQFDNIVISLARKHGIDMSDDELVLAANKWELSHGGRSGRTAQQFIDHLLGRP